MFKLCATIIATAVGIIGSVGLLPSSVTTPLCPAPEKYNSLLSYEISISPDKKFLQMKSFTHCNLIYNANSCIITARTANLLLLYEVYHKINLK